MGLDQFKQRLIDASAQLEVNLTDAQVQTLLSYLQQLQRWNKTYNLTALRDPEQMLIQHLFDSLAIVPAIHQLASSNPRVGFSILDVGSGGGLPGVVLATVCSTWNVSCIDAVEKKIAFIRQMSAVLQLPNLKGIHKRVEQIEPLDADLIVSRAFASLYDFVSLTEKHLAATGKIVAMKAKEPTEEIVELEEKTRWRVDRIESLSVPELDAERCLVYLIKG